jgi:hypothetical protein
MNPTLAEMVIQSRMADVQRAAVPRPEGNRGPVWRNAVMARWVSDSAHSGTVRTTGLRRATGWFLVRVGLRLALPHQRSLPAL